MVWLRGGASDQAPSRERAFLCVCVCVSPGVFWVGRFGVARYSLSLSLRSSGPLSRGRVSYCRTHRRSPVPPRERPRFFFLAPTNESRARLNRRHDRRERKPARPKRAPQKNSGSHTHTHTHTHTYIHTQQRRRKATTLRRETRLRIKGQLGEAATAADVRVSCGSGSDPISLAGRALVPPN